MDRTSDHRSADPGLTRDQDRTIVFAGGMHQTADIVHRRADTHQIVKHPAFQTLLQLQVFRDQS